jgi:hypothetical protein
MNGDTVSQAEQFKRRSQRLMLRIPIEVSGIDAAGAAFKEKTYTLAVNSHGARFVLLAPVLLQARLAITNLTNMKTRQFSVVDHVENPSSGMPEWGVEGVELDPSFWGINFPDEMPRGTPPEVMDVVQECSRCHSRRAVQMTPEQYNNVSAQSVLTRECPNCGMNTEWTLRVTRSENGGVTGPRPAVISPPTASRATRRRSNRVSLKLPVRVRLEDVGETENISKTGVCFSSKLEIRIGDRVRLTVGYSPGANEKEVSARVVWKRRVEGEGRALYGAELEGGI